LARIQPSAASGIARHLRRRDLARIQPSAASGIARHLRCRDLARTSAPRCFQFKPRLTVHAICG
jgi:hypothetical protein